MLRGFAISVLVLWGLSALFGGWFVSEANQIDLQHPLCRQASLDVPGGAFPASDLALAVRSICLLPKDRPKD